MDICLVLMPHGSVENKKTFPMISHLLKTKLYKSETMMFHGGHIECSAGRNKLY